MISRKILVNLKLACVCAFSTHALCNSFCKYVIALIHIIRKAVIWSVVKNMPGYIHHVEWCVSDLKNQVNKLISHFGFQIVGQRLRHVQPCWKIQQVLVQSGDTLFLLTEKTRQESCISCMYF